VRLLLDANVVVSAAISRAGAPRLLIEAWLDGDIDVVVSPRLLGEVERTLASPKLAGLVRADDAAEILRLLRERGDCVDDASEDPPLRSIDPDDDYLLALAARERVPLVSGDRHLLELSERAPVLTPRQAAALLEAR
jgi:putative PIN family toxin of toxin-antitoxin system